MQFQSSSQSAPVLITGVQGMIGCRVARMLEHDGRRVLGLDSRPGRWSPTRGGGFWIGDIRNGELLSNLVPEGGQVLHLASVVGVCEVLRRPRECFEVSVEGTNQLAVLCRQRDARLLFTSSSEVYGDGAGRKLSEKDALPENYGPWPRAAYPEGKRLAEEIVLSVESGRVARLFNVSGPGQASETGMVLPTFVRACLDGSPLPLIGGGQDLRCFQHVDDAAHALIKFLDAPVGVQRLLNIGGSERWTMAALAQEVQRILGRKVGTRRVSAEERYGGPAGGCHHREPDLSSLQRELGHRARRGLAQIVQDLAMDLDLRARSAV
jgi:nucleoside-diphosphate-sugar epimerase